MTSLGSQTAASSGLRFINVIMTRGSPGFPLCAAAPFKPISPLPYNQGVYCEELSDLRIKKALHEQFRKKQLKRGGETSRTISLKRKDLGHTTRLLQNFRSHSIFSLTSCCFRLPLLF